MSSGVDGAASVPHYPCCTFLGAVAALYIASGKQIWKTYAIDETPQPTRKCPQGVQYSGPSGAAIWSSPTADLKRHVIYVVTGNNYSAPETTTSDAVMEMDMTTGKEIRIRQLRQRDRR